MIRTYIINRNELEKINYSEDIFSADRKEKISKLKRDEDKQLSTCAGLLLIYALRQHIQDLALPLAIQEDERNKPFLKDSPYYFNLSHAKEYAACAVSDQPVGVDIEYFRVKEVIGADRMLHPEEAATMAYISNPDEKKKFFYECWVSKESYLKNLGIGLIVRPRDFMVNGDRLTILDKDFLQPKGHHSVKVPETKNGNEKQADNTLYENLSYLEKRYVHVFEPGEVRGTNWKFDAGYRMAVCSMEKDTDCKARLVNAGDINGILEINK